MEKKIEIESEENYRAISSYLGQKAFGSVMFVNQGVKIYYLTKELDKTVKIDNRKKTIELSDKAGQEIIDDIKKMIRDSHK